MSPQAATVSSTPTNQVASESAFTATGRSPVERAWPARAAAASSASTRNCRAIRSSTSPVVVGVHGTVRRSTGLPTWRSSARIRWLTAEGVSCNSRAAPSNVP